MELTINDAYELACEMSNRLEPKVLAALMENATKEKWEEFYNNAIDRFAGFILEAAGYDVTFDSVSGEIYRADKPK